MTTMVLGGDREIGASREGANGKEVLFALYPEGWKAKEPERVHLTATLRWLMDVPPQDQEKEPFPIYVRPDVEGFHVTLPKNLMKDNGRPIPHRLCVSFLMVTESTNLER